MPDYAVFLVGLAHYEVAEERQVSGELVLQAHEHGSVDVALAGGDDAVVGEVPERRARGDAVEIGVYDFGPAAEREGVHAELLPHAADGGVEGGGLFEVFLGGFRAGGVGFHDFERLVELRLRDVLGVVHDLEHHYVFELGPELRAQHHFVAAGGVEARDAPADKPYAHLGNRVHCADDADRLVEILLRLFVADVSVDVEIRDVEAVHEVRVHVGRAERVCLKPSARGIGLHYRP